MFLFSSKPTPEKIRKFLEDCSDSAFSYREAGATRDETPAGYTVDRNRINLGAGLHDFEKAKTAVRNWKMFDMPWIELYQPNTPIEEGSIVAILVRHFGFYSLNAARIVYVIDETDRFGFAYGTLSEHGESGEERFLVERDPETDDVYYVLLAFSRPGHILTWFGYPYARHLQKQFASDSKTAMLKATTGVGIT